MRPILTALSLLTTLIISGCNLGFSHDEHIRGHYRLIAVDIAQQMNISYSLDGGSAIGRIEETVFSYGFDQRFIVAKQYPKNDQSIINYFYLDMSKDSELSEPSDSVTGPLTQKEFEKASERLNLPKFTRTINVPK